MSPRTWTAALATLCLAGLAVPAAAGPQERALPPRAVVPHPVVIEEDPATFSYARQARSDWELTALDRGGNTLVVTHADSGVSLHLDYAEDAQRRPGISPDTGCGPMEGTFWGVTTPLLYPILDPDDHRIEDVEVVMAGEEVRVRMSGGSYDLLVPGAGDEPFFMDATFTVEDGQLQAQTSGLHYVLPSKDPATTITLTTQDGESTSRTFTMASPTGREYFDDVRHVLVQDGSYGDFELTTDIERLQTDLNTAPVLDVFELDMDHTLKDRGQRVVNSMFTWAADCG